MRKLISIVVALLDILLLLASGAMLFVVSAMSIMLFDSGESLKTWAIFLTICAVCVLLEGIAIYLGFRFYKKQRYLYSILGSAIPLFAFGILQLIAGAVL